MNRENVIKELINLPTTIYDGFYQLRITHDLRDEIVKLLKEQDYRGWLMDMFHKYGRDDLIALLVLHGEEELLADVLKEQETKGKNRLPYSPDSNVQWT